MNRENDSKVDLQDPFSRCHWSLSTESSTVYHPDQRGQVPLVVRQRGAGVTMRSEHDNLWLELRAAESGPTLVCDGRELAPEEVDVSDVSCWELRVGSRHKFAYALVGGSALINGFCVQCVLEHIASLEDKTPAPRPSSCARAADDMDGPGA